MASYAAKENVLAAADAAVTLVPADPESHLIRGKLLEARGDYAAAAAEYQAAAERRPDDYVLWLMLAQARELNQEREAAIAAARKALPLAPFYAQPHWRLGNLLVRAGQVDEGFKELRLAAASNPGFLPSIINLAWDRSSGSFDFVKSAIQPQTQQSYQYLGEFFRKQGQTTEAIAMLAAGGNDEDAQRARRQYLSDLFAAKKFKEAYQLWSIGRDSGTLVGALINPGFEHEVESSQPSFGWRKSSIMPSVGVSLDTANPKEGMSSLRVDFNGDSDSNVALISQLILAEPKTHYELRFAFRTEDIVSGGLPKLLVVDADNNNVFGQSDPFKQSTNGWQEARIDFNSKESTAAFQIILQRDPCSSSPCPIFGRLWLDGFSLQPRPRS